MHICNTNTNALLLQWQKFYPKHAKFTGPGLTRAESETITSVYSSGSQTLVVRRPLSETIKYRGSLVRILLQRSSEGQKKKVITLKPSLILSISSQK